MILEKWKLYPTGISAQITQSDLVQFWPFSLYHATPQVPLRDRETGLRVIKNVSNLSGCYTGTTK